jgi:Ca2+-binding EF-hand superfamily protein
VQRATKTYIPMRDFEITRVQFHDIFVDSSYIQPVVTTIMRQAAEYAQYEKDEAKGDKAVPVSTSEADKAAAAIAAKKALEYDVAAVISQLKGLHDHNFNMFLATAAVPSHRFFLSSLPKGANVALDKLPAATAKKHDAMARIRIVEVFIVLSIMCKGIVAHKLAFIYHLFHDSYPWELEKVSSDVWLLSRNPFCIADSTRISLRVDQVVEMMMSIVNAMRRIGMSVADVPLHLQNPERAMASLPKAGALSAVLTGQNSRGAKRFRAAVDLITKAARSGLLPQLLKAKSPSARNLWSDPPTFSVPRVGNMLQLVQSAQTADALKKLLQADESRPLTPGSAAIADHPIATPSLRTVSSRQFGESARSPDSNASNPRAGIITEQGSSTGTKLDQTAFVRLEKTRLLVTDGLDDDSPNSNAFVMVKKVMDCEDAASRGTDGHGISHKSVFRPPLPKGLRQPTLGDLSSASQPAALLSPRERNAAIESVFVPPSDCCWLLGLVLTMTESPERWRRLSAAKRKIVFNTPVGRTMRASAILLDYYVQSIEHVTQLAVDLIADVSNAQAYIAADHVDPLSAADTFDTPPTSMAPVKRESGLRGPTLKRLTSGQFDAPSIPTSDSTLHLFQQATKSLDRYTALTKQNIPLTLLMDWYVSHPIPRYIIRQFHYSLGKIATYEGMNCEAPPADSRHARSLASESFQSTTDITVILGRLASQAGLDVYSLRELRDLCEPQCDDSMSMPYEEFCALLPPFLERLASARHQASLAWHEMPKGEITKPAPRVPKYYTMTEIARKRLAKNLLACADLHGVGHVNVAEFIVQLLRVTQGEAKEKLMLLFDVYDPDHDMQVTLRELGSIILGALRVSDLSEHAASFEKRQDDIEFSHELACGLDVNGDGNISR